MGDLQSIVTLGILAVIGVLFLFGFLRGLRKGFYKSLMDIGFVALCVTLSVMISKWLTNSLTDIVGMTETLNNLKAELTGNPDMVEMIDNLLEYIGQVSDNPEMINVILALPAALITPIIFIPIYIVLGIIIKIPKLIIERIVAGPNGGAKYRGGNRLLGGALGGVRNALFAVVLLIPIIGYVNLVGDTLDTVESVSNDNSQTVTVSANVSSEKESGTVFLSSSSSEVSDIKKDFIDPIRESAPVKGISACGGWIFDILTTKTVEVENVNTKEVKKVTISASDEVNTFAELYANATPFIGTEPADYGEEQKEGIENIQEMLKDSEFLTFVVSEALSYVSEKWVNGEAAFGVEKMDVGEEYQAIFDGLLVTLSTTDSENIKGDIDTISNLITVCIDEGIFKELAKDEPDPLALISNEDFVVAIFTEIYKNERTRPIIGYMSEIIVDVVYESFAAEGDATEKPDGVDMGTVTEDDVKNDAKIIVGVVEKFTDFTKSIENLDSSDSNAFIMNADLASLGAALDMLRESVLLGDTCEYLLNVMLKSDMITELGFVNDDLISKLTDKNFKLENTLASTQKLAIMALSLSDKEISEENYEEALKFMISEMTPETAETIKSAISSEALKDFGMSEEEAGTVSTTISSVLDGIASAKTDMTDEELEQEMEAVSTLVNTMKDAVSVVEGGGDASDIQNVFGTKEDSKTGVTAESIVDTIVSSQIVSSAIISSTKTEDEDGNVVAVEDPFGLAGAMSDADKVAAESAIKDYYTENSASGEADEDLKNTLGAIATIMGMDSSAWFN